MTLFADGWVPLDYAHKAGKVPAPMLDLAIQLAPYWPGMSMQLPDTEPYMVWISDRAHDPGTVCSLWMSWHTLNETLTLEIWAENNRIFRQSWDPRLDEYPTREQIDYFYGFVSTLLTDDDPLL
jgi:hypothetical protein